MRKALLICLSAFVILGTSCKKDEDKSAVTKENIAGTYKLTASTLKMSGSPTEQDLIQYMDACDKDDTYTLKTDFTYQVADAGVACSPSNNDTGTWSLPSTTSIVIDGEAWTISSFDGSKLVLTQSETQSGITYTYTMTITKI